MTKVKEKLELRKRITKEDALAVFENCYKELFEAFDDGLAKYNQEIQQTIPEARVRLIAPLLNAKMTESFILHFPDNYSKGKYGRIIFRWDGISMLIKKLDKHGKPMYIPTLLSDAIQKQQQMSLFPNDDAADQDAILFFGYTKTASGELVNPRIVYYNDGVEWVADAADMGFEQTASGIKQAKPTVRLKKKEERKQA